MTRSDHWLVRPRTLRLLWAVFAVALAGSVTVQWAFPVHAHFAPAEWFGFHAGYGFGTCLLMVWAAKLLGRFLKRPDDYYPHE